VYVDAKDRLWVVDPASPQMAGVVSGGAKLVEISPATRRVLRVIRFDERIAPPGSYLNDVRVDTEREFAYITDSGTGGIVVVDLTTNQAWRRLDTSPSTKADPAVILSVGGRRLVLGGEEGNGEFLRVHVDGLALSPDGEWLYYQALTGRTLYRVPAALLRDPEVSDLRVDGAVENLGLTVATDGMAMDAAGNLYFTAIERDAIVYRTPQGRMGILAQDERLRWPDSLAISDGGEGPWLYVSTSQIHLTPWFRVDGQMPETPYYVLKMGLLRE
jgi:sugar lactone lactonase YvrE